MTLAGALPPPAPRPITTHNTLVLKLLLLMTVETMPHSLLAVKHWAEVFDSSCLVAVLLESWHYCIEHGGQQQCGQ